MAERNSPRRRMDRWADWAVIGVLAVALILGWTVMIVAEGQKATFSDTESGLTVSYPKDWLLTTNPGLVFEAVDPSALQFKTTYQVRVWPIDATAGVTATLVVALNNASLARGAEVTAYRLYDVVDGEEIDGGASMEASYAYVCDGDSLRVQRLPVVVEGLDVAVVRGDRAYVFSLLSAQDAFQDAKRSFRRFVETAKIR